MSSNIEKYRQDLDRLIKKGKDLALDLWDKTEQNNKPKKDKNVGELFHTNYECWYSEASEVIRQILPHRLDDFQSCYKRDSRKEIDYESYTISDYLIGVVITKGGGWVFNPGLAAFYKCKQQVKILESIQSRFESTLFDIKQLVRADIFDSEIDAASELLKSNFLRPAGAVVGVILEKHLAQVCDNHNIDVGKKNPGIADSNDLLKNSGIIDVVNWRFIQRLGDLRNLCVHNKGREPKVDEVQELIDGVNKTTKTLF
jgi:hypothetical protein